MTRATRVRSTIVKRSEVAGRTIRELSCGHKQEETSGGKAKHATEAECKTCSGNKTAGFAAAPASDELPGTF